LGQPLINRTWVNHLSTVLGSTTYQPSMDQPRISRNWANHLSTVIGSTTYQP